MLTRRLDLARPDPVDVRSILEQLVRPLELLEAEEAAL